MLISQVTYHGEPTVIIPRLVTHHYEQELADVFSPVVDDDDDGVC
jgi:hypothetical protein